MQEKFKPKEFALLSLLRSDETKKSYLQFSTIIAGFPGIGKSVSTKKLTEMGLKVSDSDSSKFSWIIDADGNKVRNPNFKQDYLNEIKTRFNEGNDYVFISTHKDTRDVLIENNICFSLFYPTRDRKEEFLEVYRQRGDVFVDIFDKNWDNFIDEIESLEGIEQVSLCPLKSEKLDHFVGCRDSKREIREMLGDKWKI